MATTTDPNYVEVWKNYGTANAQPISSSDDTLPHSQVVTAVANGDIFSLLVPDPSGDPTLATILATFTEVVSGTAPTLTASPNPVQAGSTTTLTWDAAGYSATAIFVGGNSGTPLTTGGASGTATSAALNQTTVFNLVDTTNSNNLLATVTVGVIQPIGTLTASPNPIDVTSATYSTTLSWTSPFSTNNIVADNPFSGAVISAANATSGSISVNQTQLPNSRRFFLISGNFLLANVLVILSAPNELFGIIIPPQLVSQVFPIDPDFSFTKSRKWETETLEFAPNLIRQAYVMHSVPEITYEVGFEVAFGEIGETGSKFDLLYQFYLKMQGSDKRFYFYDPQLWGTADYTPVNYREIPLNRLSSPGTGNNPSKTTGRYVMRFQDDNLSWERFMLKISKAQLKLVGYLG